MGMTVATLPRLGGLGNVPADYAHEWRVATPGEPIVAPGAVAKRSLVHRGGGEVAPALAAEARATVVAALQGGVCRPEYGLGFALLHVSTSHAFPVVGSWRGHQECWKVIWVKELGEAAPFAVVPANGEERPLACVWELAVVCHERMAWHRYLFSARDEAAKRAWLADTYAGTA